MSFEDRGIRTEQLQPGTTLAGRYEVERLIGQGGMAFVYLALDHQRGRHPVAVKVLHKEFATEKKHVERFLREVQLLGKVDHPRVVKMLEMGTDRGLIYFTMEYVPSVSLEQMLDKGRYDLSHIADLTIQLAEGLEAIHNEGIFHRDLKPGNILVLDDGSIKITDFGVAREKYSRLTAANQKVGSLSYIAPELWLGKKVSVAVDMYSLGVVLYEAATGELLFDDQYPGEAMKSHLEGKISPPKEKNSEIPDWLNELIMRLLARDPKERPSNAREIIEYVEFCAGQGGRFKKFSKVQVRDDSNVQPQVFAPHTVREEETPYRSSINTRGKTYVFSLTSSRLMSDAKKSSKAHKAPRRKATMIIPLPRQAAIVFEIEPPSRDFIYFGVFLASLQVLDGLFTSIGVNRMGLQVEGNFLLRWLMERFGADATLITVKLFAIMIVIALTVLAKRSQRVKDVITVLSCLYLIAAIIPWTYLLFFKATH